MTDKYVCTSLVNNVCTAWAKSDDNQALNALFSLSLDDAWQIGLATALLFAVAWVYRELYAFTKRT